MSDSKHIKLIILLLTIILQVGNSQGARFYLRASQDRVEVGQTFELEAVLENMESRDIQLPDVTPFTIVQGPFVYSSHSSINGKVTATISYKYILLAPQVGKYNLPPATTKVGSKVIKSNSITITVEKSTQKAQNDIKPEGESFVRLEASVLNAYVGQQIVLDYVVYTRQNIESYRILNDPNFDGFFAQPVTDIRDQATKKMIKGKEYYSQVIRRHILFPQKTGKYTIGPSNIALDILADENTTSFFFRDVKTTNISTNSVTIHIKKLPEGAPKSFTGAVGQFEMEAEILKRTVKQNESITLKMMVEGDGDPKIVTAPILNLSSTHVEVYEPNLINDEVRPQGQKLGMSKTFEYIIVPKKDSSFVLMPEFTYFSPDEGKYITIKSNPININVVQGIGPFVESTVNDGQNKEISSDIRLFQKSNEWFLTWKHTVSILFISMMTFIALYLKKKKQNMINHQKVAIIDPENEIITSFEQLQKYINSKEDKIFYQELLASLNSYIVKKLELNPSEATSTEILKILNDITPLAGAEHAYKYIVQQCELAKYAAVFGDKNSIFESAQSLVDQIRGYKQKN